MSWVMEAGFAKRPLVVVEDHLYHMTELLDGLGEAPDLVGQLTVVCLDRPGPDTRRTVATWLADHPELQVVAAVEAPELPAGAGRTGDGAAGDVAAGDGEGGDGAAGDGAAGDGAAGRLRPLPAAAFTSASRLCQAVAGALRPGGLLLQDVQLSTLAFIPADRWWESIYLASTVRGMFAERPPACRFVSNKRGYEATFGRDLLDAGFDPRDVIDKAEIARSVVPVVRAFLEGSFPMALRLAAPGRAPWELRVARLESEREEIERAVDLLLWSGGDGAAELGAAAASRSASRRAGASPSRPRTRKRSPGATWWRTASRGGPASPSSTSAAASRRPMPAVPSSPTPPPGTCTRCAPASTIRRPSSPPGIAIASASG